MQSPKSDVHIFAAGRLHQIACFFSREPHACTSYALPTGMYEKPNTNIYIYTEMERARKREGERDKDVMLYCLWFLLLCGFDMRP